MSVQPVVIVDPVSSGSEIAPAFASRGIPCLAVLTKEFSTSIEVGYGSGIRVHDFQEVFTNTIDLVEKLRLRRPRAIIAGSEGGVPLADRLASELTPNLANDLSLSTARRNKGAMQRALILAGLPSILTIETSSPQEVEDWLREQHLDAQALIVKPAESSGSDHVYHIPTKGDWFTPFHEILNSQNGLLETKNQSVVVQEQLFGIEFAVDTVSANGQHYLAHLIRYQKTNAGNRLTVFDHTEFIAFDPNEHSELITYTFKCLDALGLKWGAAHTEIMMTKHGPRLIETGARLCGGPAVRFAHAATGSSQLERLIQLYADGNVKDKSYHHNETVVPIFIRAFHSGIIQNIEILKSLQNLKTHHSIYSWLQNGSYVERTVDFDSIIGIVALKGDRDAIFTDYQKVREIEQQILIVAFESHLSAPRLY